MTYIPRPGDAVVAGVKSIATTVDSVIDADTFGAFVKATCTAGRIQSVGFEGRGRA